MSGAAMETDRPDGPSSIGPDVTTLMLRYVPRKFTGIDLVKELERHVPRSSFNYVYVPWDRCSTNNMGYAFANFVDSATARTIAKAMHGNTLANDHRGRMVSVLPARVQGLSRNLRRYDETHFHLEPDIEHSPLIYCKGVEIPLRLAIELNCQQGFGDSSVASLPGRDVPSCFSLPSLSDVKGPSPQTQAVVRMQDFASDSSTVDDLSRISTFVARTTEAEFQDPSTYSSPGKALCPPSVAASFRTLASTGAAVGTSAGARAGVYASTGGASSASVFVPLLGGDVSGGFYDLVAGSNDVKNLPGYYSAWREVYGLLTELQHTGAF
eukprot:CAMPEP_0203969362 /NCGR_PEP_ID=MMETSP0359-20131031/97420_1 /ASSEMBLY_ACC=CAM_ASM_000338 /TAXON_ID=268821 /ORGANISM="Scrippsiella Hangoei, Strain SHTV-5" /LENGTH=324 /DNA_ID=CAMNT_0050907299 /DNA_START=60 /DNA_END=1034 /DNA_ORIENTATION=-